uniref:Uncharacterized protein n=1 Tax=Arundo donax TaxID=35708 RepID=A0A0A9BFM7_ARUDO
MHQFQQQRFYQNLA